MRKKMFLGALALVLVLCMIVTTAIAVESDAEDNDGYLLGASSSATVGERWTYTSSIIGSYDLTSDDLSLNVQKPSWLSRSGSTFSGIPSAAGTYTLDISIYSNASNSVIDSELVTINVSSGSGGSTTTYYTITYDQNGATRWDLNYTSQRLVSGSTVDLPTGRDIGRLYYTLDGWKIGSTTYAPGATYTVKSNVTAVAQWSSSTIEVTLFNNGGICDASSAGWITSSHDSGDYITLPSSGYSKPGYIFSGWNTRADGTGTHYDLGQKVQVMTYMSFYAQYATPTLTINCDDVISQLDSSAGVLLLDANTVSVAAGTIVYLPSLDSRLNDGWIQVVTGWKDANGNSVGMQIELNQSLILSPIWTNYFRLNVSDPSVAVEFDNYWSSYSNHRIDWGNGHTVTVDNIVSQSLTYQYAVNATYVITVQSSYLDGKVSGTNSAEIFNALDAVLHAITFDTAGGTIIASQMIATGDKVTVPIDPRKDGFTFAGWYKDADCIDEYDFTVPVDSDLTIYAKWIDNILCKVSFETFGGSGVDTRYVESGTKLAMPLDPIRDGYQFSGWCVNANCTVLFDFDTVIVENMTLYAKWDKIAAEGGSGSFSYSWLVLLLIAVFVIIAIFKDVSK
ncbi:InlB B-repeat-containing protein [Candidatus Methanomassiliicoccus intestinalis]|uniref:InlB B-repeat-containing protein n=1 Tax=Candidatus Methanomassiliicoccus intestinalis TaxID=1406512 RepID=UPI0037DD3D04